MKKKIILPAIISLLSGLLLLLIYFSVIKFGKFLNIFLQCKQAPENSFPCYGAYDINMMLFLGTVSIGFLVILFINLYKNIVVNNIKKQRVKKTIFYVMLLLYLLALVKLIVFKYPPGVTFSIANSNLIPFKTIFGYLSGEPTWATARLNLLGNIVVLVPLGLFIAIRYEKIKWGRVLLFGLFAGIILELSQVIFRSGILDIDDVILNFLGVVFGYFLFLFFKNIFKQNV